MKQNKKKAYSLQLSSQILFHYLFPADIPAGSVLWISVGNWLFCTRILVIQTAPHIGVSDRQKSRYTVTCTILRFRSAVSMYVHYVLYTISLETYLNIFIYMLITAMLFSWEVGYTSQSIFCELINSSQLKLKHRDTNREQFIKEYFNLDSLSSERKGRLHNNKCIRKGKFVII